MGYGAHSVFSGSRSTEHTSRAPPPPPPPQRSVAAEGAGRRRRPRSQRRSRGGEGRDRSAASVARNPLGAWPSQAGCRGVDRPCARAPLAAGATATSSRRRPTLGVANRVVASVAGDEGLRPQFARSRPGPPLTEVPALCDSREPCRQQGMTAAGESSAEGHSPAVPGEALAAAGRAAHAEARARSPRAGGPRRRPPGAAPGGSYRS